MKNKDKLIKLIKAHASEINEEMYLNAIKELIEEDILSVLVEAHNNPDLETIFRSPLFSNFWEKILFSSPDIKKAMNHFNEERPNAVITLPRNFQVSSYDKIMGLVLFIYTCQEVPTQEREAKLKIIAEKYHSYHSADYLISIAFETATLEEKIKLIEWFANAAWQNGAVTYEKIANRFAEIADIDGKSYDKLIKKMRIYHVISNKILSLSDHIGAENSHTPSTQNIQRAFNPRLFKTYEQSCRFSGEEKQFIEDEYYKYAIHLAAISGVRHAFLNPQL